MITLSTIFTSRQTVELIEPRRYTGVYVPQLRLLLTDIETGEMREVTIEADAFVVPEAGGVLVVSVMDVDEPEFDYEHGEFVDDGESVVIEEVELPAEWCVTPWGEEVDLHAVSGGLF